MDSDPSPTTSLIFCVLCVPSRQRKVEQASCLFIPKLPMRVTTNHPKPREYEKVTCIKKAEDWRPNGIAATKVLIVHRLLRRTTKGISIFTANLLIGIEVVFGGTGTLTKLKRNLSVHKRFPAQPVFITQVFFSYRLSTLNFAYKKVLE